MHVEEVDYRPRPPAFVPFSIRIDIESRDELEALRLATVCMTNGLQLYDLLEAKARQLR